VNFSIDKTRLPDASLQYSMAQVFLLFATKCRRRIRLRGLVCSTLNLQRISQTCATCLLGLTVVSSLWMEIVNRLSHCRVREKR